MTETTPSQAEGEREPDDVPTEPDHSTPSQAEGEREPDEGEEA
ncbi:hypothetical protein [Streptomyces longwoodensis]|nr:hypothetical protein [Streptomyces longwoodensis]